MKKIEEYLQEMGVEKKKISFYVEKVIKFLAIAIVIGILFIISQLAIFYGIFAWIGAQIRVLTGLDEFITKGIAFLVMALFFGTPLGGFIWSFTPIPQKKKDRRKKRVIFLVVLAALCFISFFASRNVYFNVRTGEAEKYYSVGIDGEYVFYSSPGFDPITGDELRPVTKDVMENHFSSSTQTAGSKNLSKELISKENHGEYRVTFVNESERNLFLFVAKNYNPEEPLISYNKIEAGKKRSFDLQEGLHFMVFLDSDGFNRGIHKTYGSSVGSMFVPDFFKVKFKDKVQEIEEVFMLEVKADNNQSVVFDKKDRVCYSKEISRGYIGTMFLFLGISIFAILIYINKHSKNQGHEK